MAVVNGLFRPPCCVILFHTSAPDNTWREVLLAGCVVGTELMGELNLQVGTGSDWAVL
jgi:hypothetical protein